MSRKTESIYFGCLAILFILVGIIFLFCECYPFTDGPPNEACQGLLFFVIFLIMPIMAGYGAILCIPAALIASIFLKGIWRFRLLMLCVVYAVAFGVAVACVSVKIPWRVRQAACKRICQRAEPIIQAIESYRAQEDKYPQFFNDLMPNYLDSIPGTGLRGYPYFKYELLDSNNRAYTYLYEKHNAPYELKVDLYRMFGWDCFFYWTSEDYPDIIYGGETEIINKWAYVHE